MIPSKKYPVAKTLLFIAWNTYNVQIIIMDSSRSWIALVWNLSIDEKQNVTLIDLLVFPSCINFQMRLPSVYTYNGIHQRFVLYSADSGRYSESELSDWTLACCVTWNIYLHDDMHQF